MSFLDRFRKQEPQELTPVRALDILKRRGFWGALPGTKAADKSRAHLFPYADAVGFAVDADPTIPDDQKPVLVINSAQDLEMFQDPTMLADAVKVGYCSPEVKGRRFVVVPRA